jgi:hypothetical protein
MACKIGRGTVVGGSRGRPWARLLPPLAGALAALLAALLPGAAQAAHNPETIDKIADVLTIVVLILVPVVGIVAFLAVHVIPEKIAEKRHHPQATAIKTLCFLSLVFGGLLWPLAWLWAFSKPVLYKMAYGTDTLDPHAAEGHAAAATAPAFVTAPAAAPVAVAAAAAPAVLAPTAAAPAVLAPTAEEGSASAKLMGLRDELLSMQLQAMQQRIDRLAASLGGSKADGKGTV